MSENQFQVVTAGTSVIKADFNQLGSYALMDDRVLAEFLRLAPFNGVTPDRAIFPYGVTGETITSSSYRGHAAATVAPNGATGSVLLRPFRAFVGSRTAMASDAKANWRDIRSAVYVGSGSSLTAAVTLAANASGNPRWDLVYATISPDANTTPVTRKLKSTSTGAIADGSVVTTLQSTVAVAVVTGTPGASPVWPAVPADGAGAYVIPLAYVRVPNGFSGTSIVAGTDIAAAMPIAQPVGSMAPASANLTTNTTSAKQQTWGATGTRPGYLLPPDLNKGPSKVIPIDLLNASSANWSHASGGIVDASMDWRNRMFRIHAIVSNTGVSASNPFTWDPAGGANPTIQIPSHKVLGGLTVTETPTIHPATTQHVLDYGAGSRTLVTSLSESLNNTTNVSPAFQGGVVWYYDPTADAAMAAATKVWLVADATTGNLLLYVSGAPGIAIFLWIDSTTQFPNSL